MNIRYVENIILDTVAVNARLAAREIRRRRLSDAEDPTAQRKRLRSKTPARRFRIGPSSATALGSARAKRASSGSGLCG